MPLDNDEAPTVSFWRLSISLVPNLLSPSPQSDGIQVGQPFKDEKAKPAAVVAEDSMRIVFGAREIRLEVRHDAAKAVAKEHIKLAVMSLFAAVFKCIVIKLMHHKFVVSDIPAAAGKTIIFFSFSVQSPRTFYAPSF
ncbi:hypothetical protein M413DRAFT_143402 [Hebeloma cylindrosporum]|uniref:Uncharacterized protein n=1 Tax=Hebeloma cylindrosporum TaxID=76867 RepID=A0A0C2YLZ5_HEBCY|nr:hypothetical protein M413DRAFT_143402 [Hebeloma cylindrosporum h7]